MHTIDPTRPTSADRPAPAYVEPNPTVFYRMAYLARSLQAGVEGTWGSISPAEQPDPEDFYYPRDVTELIHSYADFANQLQSLGDIAAKELAGQPLTSEDYGIIQACLGPVECQVEYMKSMLQLAGSQAPDMDMPPVPVIASVAGAEENILEVGVGGVDRIYVIVPLEGRLEVAQGGVFSYYEFSQPRANRLTDEDWRNKLSSDPPDRPAWAATFSFTGGKPVADVIFFRKGDIYLINEAGDKLNLRSQASTNAAVVTQLRTGDYIEIVDGPVKSGPYTWWKVKQAGWSEEVEGWCVENQTWFERAWGQ